MHLHLLCRLPFIACVLSMSLPSIGNAEVNVSAAQNIDISLRTRIQPVYYYSDNPVIADRDTHDFRIRRARLSIKAGLENRYFTYLQTGYSEDPNNGSADAKIIDAYVYFKANKNFNLYAGQFLAPALRQNVTSAGSLLTFDRPGVIYKSLSWGTRALAKFSSLTMNNTDAGLRGTVDVRDIGVMAINTHSFSEKFHYKIYASVTEGARTASGERGIIRGQLNFGNAESGHFNHSSYLGKKETFSLGLSWDTQPNVAFDSTNEKLVDYELLSVDAFWEKKIAASALNLEAAWITLDLDNAGVLSDPNNMTPISSNAAVQSQGSGYYIQSALIFRRWQPWLGLESWQSDAEDETGSYDGIRLGFTYYLQGQQANIKFGIEKISAKQAFSTRLAETDSITTISGGIFFTF